jgi:hypothetical protein
VLEKMKALRSSGVAYDKIAAILNREGIKPRRGERWHPFTVSKIMTKHGVVKGERVDG